MSISLLALTGLTMDQVTLISPSKLAHVLSTRGVLAALRSFLQDASLKSILLLWHVFAPYVLMRQILAVLILQLMHEGIVPAIKSRLFPPEKAHNHVVASPDADPNELKRLDNEMEMATNYYEWRDAQRLHDAILERNAAAQLTPSALARIERMQSKTALYRELVDRMDLDELQFRLRSELHRKQWNSSSRDNAAYREALNDYLTSVCDALALIAKGRVAEDRETSAEECRTRMDFFSETLHSFGRTALLLSGGARLGLQHLGVIKALRDQRLIPRVISGSSAGSIVAVMLGAFRDDELDDRLFTPENLNLKFFEFVSREETTGEVNASSADKSWLQSLLLLPPPFPLLFHALSNVLPTYWKTGALLNVHVLSQAIRDAIGDITFLEAFHRTGRIINITVSPSGEGGNDFPMLLNYLTTPQVLMWSASVASCAIPGVFAPVELLAKDKEGNLVPYYPEGMKWADGSVEADLPMQRLSELFNVNNFVVSQVNPHARFLAPIQTVHLDGALEKQRLATKLGLAIERSTKTVVDFCRDQCRSSVKHFATTLMTLPEIQVFPFTAFKSLGRSLVPILTQKYTGSITIMPPLSLRGMATILVNPTPQDFLEDIARGERITWPHISKLRLSVAIEFLLDDCRQSCITKLEELNVSMTSSPRAMQRKSMQIPTASVLNLQELANLQAVRTSPVQQQQSTTGGFKRMNSLVALSNKLRNRVESFADDLNVMRDVEAKFHRRLEGHGEEEDEDEDEGNTF